MSHFATPPTPTPQKTPPIRRLVVFTGKLT
jgi:hypothetical protein